MVSAKLLEIWYFIFVSSKIERSSVLACGTQNPAIEELEESLEFLITHLNTTSLPVGLHAFLPPRVRRRNNLTACILHRFGTYDLVHALSEMDWVPPSTQDRFGFDHVVENTLRALAALPTAPPSVSVSSLLPNDVLSSCAIFVHLVTNSLRCGAIFISCIARVIFSFSV
ncbi:hypothetical protein F2Q70_00028440 [Brassica cretica]|uniref:Uncharacterized protein n=1 Tax=Brassica cretica TaxID=69181 RepID=A0A8S9ICM2_BRACR|nr:hypothetical protein F2Q68_00028023 [Brassica cretica]KAF2602662.1 hypothetical protein F2Q70_00028440 [Brassica cretica]